MVLLEGCLLFGGSPLRKLGPHSIGGVSLCEVVGNVKLESCLIQDEPEGGEVAQAGD